MKKLSAFLVVCLSLAALPAFSNDLALETIGAMGGSNLYLTYLSIGTLADGYEKKVYEKNQANQMATEVIALANVGKGYLEKLISQGVLTGDDVRFGQEMIATYDLLIAEGNALINYIKTGNKSHVDSFHMYRKQAWDKIADLLGLKK